MGGWESRKEAKSYGRSDEGIDAGKRVVTKTEESGGEVDASRISLQKSYGVVNLNFEGETVVTKWERVEEERGGSGGSGW